MMAANPAVVFSTKIRGIPAANRCGAGEALGRAAFSLVEVVVSLAVLTMIAGSAIWSLNQMNSTATTNRLFTGAQTLAQNQIEAFMAAQPYCPALSQIPLELVTGATMSTVTIYSDPGAGGTLAVTGTLTRTVTDLAINQTTNGVTDNLNLRRLDVTVDYNFKGDAHQVALSTVRAPDNF